MLPEVLGAGVAVRLADGFIGEPFDLGAAAGSQDVQAADVVGDRIAQQWGRGRITVNLSRCSTTSVFRVVCFAAVQES